MRSHQFLELEPSWSIASPDFELSFRYVDLWRLHLALPATDEELLQRVLSEDELTRANRFKFEGDRRRFMVARGQLRNILGRYLGTDPQKLAFSYGPRGKPHLAAPVGFNVSHSEELALVAVACQRIVGVDLEAIRVIRDFEKIAERFFSSRENAELAGMQDIERQEAFFRCWTLKEAYVKATGDGLTRPTESFDVAFSRDGPVQLLSVQGSTEEAYRWELLGFQPAPGYIGALAVEGQDWELRCFDFIL